MPGIDPKIYRFLKQLDKNNNREWFNDHKSEYKEVHFLFISFLEKLVVEIAKFDKRISEVNAEKSVFRIYRDVRFSKDKTPYHTRFGAHLIDGGKKMEQQRAGYFIRIQPNGSMLAGGAYMPPADWLNAIRQEIDYNAEEFKKIIHSTSFKKYFGEMQGEQLKRAPKNYPIDHPEIDLLRHKTFLAVHEFGEKTAISNDFLKHATTVFKTMQPFGAFLNRNAG